MTGHYEELDEGATLLVRQLAGLVLSRQPHEREAGFAEVREIANQSAVNAGMSADEAERAAAEIELWTRSYVLSAPYQVGPGPTSN